MTTRGKGGRTATTASGNAPTILPLGKYSRAANVPGREPVSAVEYEYGEPGVKQGQ